MRDHRLVGRDEALAGLQRFARQGEGRAVRSADQLDDDIDALVMSERDRIVDPIEPRNIDAAILRSIARANRDHLDRPPRAPLDQGGVGAQQANDACADGAQPCEGDAKRLRVSHNRRA